jgi:hypothetical protein
MSAAVHPEQIDCNEQVSYDSDFKQHDNCGCVEQCTHEVVIPERATHQSLGTMHRVGEAKPEECAQQDSTDPESLPGYHITPARH